MSHPVADQIEAVGHLRNKIGAVIGLRLFVALLSGWLLAWGVAVLVLRGVWFVPWQPLMWGLVGVAVAAGVALLVGFKRRPSEAVACAVLDSRGRCGGLLMTSEALEIGDWKAKVSVPEPPRVRWNGKRQWAILTACTLFLLGSFLMPARYVAPPGSRKLEVAAEVAKLSEKIALLEEEKIVPPEKAQSMEEALKQIERDTAGNDPAKTWEALDHLEQAIAKAGADAGEKAGRNAQQAAEAEALAEALQQAHDKIAGELLAEAMKALAQQVQEAGAENSTLDDKLSDELKQACENGGLNEEQLKELAKALKECKAGDLAKLKKLANAKLIDAEALKECEGGCEIDPEALAELLIACKGDKEGEDALALLLTQGGKPGKGGITRGPGSAAISWQDPSSKEDVAFKEKVLPPASIASLKDSQMQGVSKGAPTAGQPSTEAAGGALDGSAKGSGSARTQVILPEHKGVVKRYFERGGGSTPAQGKAEEAK